MNVIFISQCQKKALSRTRKILDAYANRIGDNTWQTAITEEGLAMVKKLLRQKPSKNTAVSCHRIVTRNRTQLVWIVGSKSQFNENGFVPVNKTKRHILNSDHQNDWQSLNAMLIVSTLSALMHDLGKSSVGFQNKLKKSANTGDPYRHEWISLKLFLWLIQDCQNDNEVFERLLNIDEYLIQRPFHSQDIISHIDKTQLDKLPPIAQWIAWLIATHHRLPALTDYRFKDKQKYLDADNRYFKVDLKTYYKSLFKPLDGWVKNPNSTANPYDFYQFNHLVWHSPAWQNKLKRYAKKAQNDPTLQFFCLQKEPIANPFLTILSRLSLMVGDHNYSSLGIDDKTRVAGSPDWAKILIANTDKATGNTKQALDEHLLGVANFTAQFCHKLPILHEHLPALKQHEPLQKNTASERFLWQNHAVKLAQSQSEDSQTHGFFGVNMASTGCGKTIGNARLMYALADKNKGARLTIALGLRVLTLQTGQSFRRNLVLSDSQLAILVGGVAQKQLFELGDKPQTGSESDENLLDEWVDSDDFDDVLNDLNLGTVVADTSAQKLIASPVVTCTIDHLMQASECTRGGRYIAPLLRLLSSDLILDEPDDFDQNDLPALSRLVHLAGLFGSRVLLSSATLQPDMVEGLFNAYLAGRKIYNAQFGKPSPQVVCAWFDENDCTAHLCKDSDIFSQKHQVFTQKRCQFLQKQGVRRKAKILPLAIDFNGEKQEEFYQTLAQNLLSHAQKLHHNHHIAFNHQSISIGLLRMANIQPLMKLAQAIHQLPFIENQEDTQIHLCVYHSQQVLALRNRLEVRLDTLLNRQDKDNQAFAGQDDIKNAIAQHPNKKHHIFIVLATAVAEVGRDHDYDWAIVEPSSMRSIVQLAGRVWRHRPNLQADTPNIFIWQKNIRALIRPKTIAFSQPGFESKMHPLSTHDMSKLVSPSVLDKLDANCRIIKAKNPSPTDNFADLEQTAIADLMNNQAMNVVNAYFKDPQTANRHHLHLSLLTPFRAGRANEDFIIKPSDDDLAFYNAKLVSEQGFSKQASEISQKRIETKSPFVSVWLDSSLADELARLAQSLPELSQTAIIKRFATVSLSEHQQGYWFDERFGFWRRD